MKTLKQIMLVTFVIGGLFMSTQFTQGHNALTNENIYGIGDKISAGPDAVMGFNPIFTTQGVCSYTGFTVWSTSGDGVFDNPYSLYANYTPGVQDMNLGHVTLTINLMQRGVYIREISDSMILTFTN